jgi:hypothetical protein
MLTTNPITEIKRGLPFPEYCKLSGLNQSLMKTYDPDYDGCPALFRYRATHPDIKDSNALGFGRAFHAMLLEPEAFRANYRVLTPEDCETIFQSMLRDGAASKSKAEYMRHISFKAMNESGCRGFTASKSYKDFVAGDGRELVSFSDSVALEEMSGAVWNNPDVVEEFKGVKLSDCEVTVLAPWEFKDGQMMQLKTRSDIVAAGDSLIDAKTCRSTNPRKFAADVVRYGYDIQAAFYLHAANAAGMDKNRFGFLAQEKTPPYLSCIHWLPDTWLKYSRIQMRRILNEIKESIRLDSWPNPTTGELEPPSYLLPMLEMIS